MTDKQKRVALYDLSVLPTTYDFACYAVIAKTLGYEEIRFVVDRGMATWKYASEIGWRRWANICLPICSLADIKFTVGTRSIDGDILGYKTGDVERVYESVGSIVKLKSPLTYGKKGYVTITMRQSFRGQWRNSNMPEWVKTKAWLQSQGLEVIVLPECEAEPIAIERRMAIYMNAKMNLAVGNGPMVLCWLSEAPYLTFQLPSRDGRESKYDALVGQWTKMGFPVGSQCSWRNHVQEIVWGPDDFELIRDRYVAIMGKQQHEDRTPAQAGASL